MDGMDLFCYANLTVLDCFFLWTRSTPCFFHRGFVLLQEKTDDLLEAPTCPLGTVDGSEILHQLRLVVYPIIYRAFFIPGVFFEISSINSRTLFFSSSFEIFFFWNRQEPALEGKDWFLDCKTGIRAPRFLSLGGM